MNGELQVVSAIEGQHNTLLGLIAMLRIDSAEGYACRELSLAITRLEEAEHWLALVPHMPAPSKEPRT